MGGNRRATADPNNTFQRKRVAMNQRNPTTNLASNQSAFDLRL
jgi:hypothetical protein